MAYRVVIAGQQSVLKKLLESEIPSGSEVEIVGAADSGEEAIALAERMHPDALFLDLALPGRDALDVARAVQPHVGLILLSSHSDGASIRRALQACCSAKPTDGNDVLEADGSLTRLGRREREVLRLVADGCRSREIASRLGITLGTVEAHRRNIMRKLELKSVAELTKFALRAGVISL